MNPNGKVPTLQLEDGSHLAESNAILHYLAEGSALLPAERLGRARALQWMFFEQYSHEPYIAVARFIVKFLGGDSPRRAELPRLRERGHQALAVMDQHLRSEPFFAAGRYSVADVALYAYTHCAADGGFDLSRYPAILAWLERVRGQRGHVAMG
jgi:glutathione S-transferase